MLTPGYWPCECKDKMNSANMDRCRKCGVKKPKAKMGEDKIIVVREKPTPNPRTRIPAATGEDYGVHSTMSRLED